MEEKKEYRTKTARAILFTENDHIEEYIINDKSQISISTTTVKVECNEYEWTVDAAAYPGEIRINGEVYAENERIFKVKDRDVIQFRDGQITDMILEKTEAADLQWKKMPLNECFPIIRIRHADGSGEQSEADAEAEMSADDIHEAKIRFEGKEWKLSDVRTVRGIFVNGNKISDSCILRQMDVIQAGDTLFFFGRAQMLYSHTIFQGNKLSIHIEERSVKSFFRKHILLQDINLSIDPGNMVLLLGGSGAGKTTFVNAVTGYEKAKAQILQDGMDVYENYGKLNNCASHSRYFQ